MEEKYDLFHTVLRELQNAGVLEKLILAGSWCQYYYRILFDNAPEVPLIRTSDIDFLVPSRPLIRKTADVTQILNRIGFDNDFDYHTGLVKYVHPDPEIQFITPAGRKRNTPCEIRELNINAEGLAYLTLLQDFSFRMKDGDIGIRLPEPEAYVLHKILVSRKRRNTAKRDRDLLSAGNIGELCLKDKTRRERLKTIYDSIPKKWRKKICDTWESSFCRDFL
ncbi:GSU2403 family nucleotidyltransferase fold protein [Desulfococcaceae bacterium HSG8]|nr:GSU2403 family nucleotidyltransferase fold protein [Desulfococcaceae bacterium HSG8]